MSPLPLPVQNHEKMSKIIDAISVDNASEKNRETIFKELLMAALLKPIRTSQEIGLFRQRRVSSGPKPHQQRGENPADPDFLQPGMSGTGARGKKLCKSVLL